MASPLRIHRMRVAQEAAGAANFAQELSGSIGSFLDVQHKGPAFASLPREMLANEALVQRHFQTRLSVPGAKMPEISIDTYMTPTGAALIDNVYTGSPPSDPTFALGVILQTILGGYLTEEGSTEDAVAASTPSEITVATGHGTRFVAGGVAGFTVGGAVQARQLLDVTGDVLKPTMALSAAPTDAGIVYNAHNFYLRSLGAATKALQLIVESEDRDDLHWLLGLQAQSLSLDFSLRQLVGLALQLKGADWLQDDSVGSPLGGGALAAGTLTDGDPIPALDGECLFGPAPTGAAAATLASVDASAVAISPQISHREVSAPGGVNGVRRWELDIKPEMATCELTLPSESGIIKTLETARDAKTAYMLAYQQNNVGGSTAFVTLPRLQITDVQPSDSSGTRGVKVSARALENDVATTDIGRSPMVISLL